MKTAVGFRITGVKVPFALPLYQCLAAKLPDLPPSSQRCLLTLTFLMASESGPRICLWVTVLSSFLSVLFAAFTHFLLLCSCCSIKILIFCFFVSDNFKFLHLLPAVFLVNKGLSCYSSQIINLCLTFVLYAVV